LSRLAEILSGKSSSSLQAETQSEASDPSDKKPTAARSGKMSAVGGDIRPFERLNDGKENIKIFIDHVEFLVECHDRKAPASTKTMLRVFRHFLKGDAYEFWCFLDEEVQTSWDELKAAFTNKFAVSKSISATQRINVKNQLLSLKQGSKHIFEYIKEAQNLSSRVSKELDEMLAMAFIGGMSDQTKKKCVSFVVAGEADRSGSLKFSRVVELVKSAYMVIGQESWSERSGGGTAVVTAASVASDKMDKVIRLLRGLQEVMSRSGVQYSSTDTQALVPFAPPVTQYQQPVT